MSVSEINSVTHGLTAIAFPQKMVRLAVFKFGIWHSSTYYEKFALNMWQNHFSGYGYCDNKGNYQVSRAQEMVNALLELNGKETPLIPKDREAKLQMIHLTADALRKKIEKLGGAWVKSGDRIVIEGPKQRSDQWDKFYVYLKKVFKNENIENGKPVLTTSESAKAIPFGPTAQRKTDCVLLSRLGKSFVMDKDEIAFFLGKGIDVCVYDTRGVLNSSGYVTEAGLYNDIEAVGAHLLQTYLPSKICIYGTCGESFSAVKLFCKYPGINMILQNAPGSLDRVITRINFIAAWIYGFNKAYLQAPPNSNCTNEEEDGFDSLAKLRKLSASQAHGEVILVKTMGDDLAPPKEVDEMADLLRAGNCKVNVLINTVEESMSPDRKLDDPHLAGPLRNPKVQAAYMKQLFGH